MASVRATNSPALGEDMACRQLVAQELPRGPSDG